MSTRAEHYRKAEELLGALADANKENNGKIVTALELQSLQNTISNTIEIAKVHAILATVDEKTVQTANIMGIRS